ncbi:MAG: bifunctional glutamate N-acetyltransferase/amino-acid acetyltransferase ArgJ [Propionibacteriaceae bacterium]|jgi:glutamate N-acetyltransferase/amino-acid N-acetyltransferase|nr:bifunctional glutamate N-acetyltransferase/amino-acid acetyltransferase ArgJ [Propionibacteriaceae bacterium]
MIDRTRGVTAAAGFTAAGVAAGLKTDGRLDLALVVNDGPRHDAAGVFTSNRMTAAPVIWSRQAVENGQLAVVVLNSGGANACTGPRGLADAEQMAQWTAQAVGVPARDVAVASTGLIGKWLPMPTIEAGIVAASQVLSPTGGTAAAEAIMTTDTRSKQAAWTAPAGWTVGGMAKGAGMLAPGLATMLVVLTTDAVLDSVDLSPALWSATSVSFDRADSDGCMSTNDTVLLLASGASGQVPDRAEFAHALTAVCCDLARQLIADAEGADHEIAITVKGAASEEDAVEVARSIARSNLFKCAIAGNDPNWGRALAAVGTTQAAFDPDQVDLAFNGIVLYQAGAPAADRQEVDLHPRQVDVTVDLHSGLHQATVWTNDLTHAYVSENADYSS